MVSSPDQGSNRTSGKDPVKSVIQWPFVWGRPRIRSRAELGKAPPFYSAIDEGGPQLKKLRYSGVA